MYWKWVVVAVVVAAVAIVVVAVVVSVVKINKYLVSLPIKDL